MEERVTTCVIRTNPDRQVVVSEVLGRAAVVVWLVGEGGDTRSEVVEEGGAGGGETGAVFWRTREVGELCHTDNRTYLLHYH